MPEVEEECAGSYSVIAKDDKNAHKRTRSTTRSTELRE
jgi:hypothetical protein